MPARPLCHRWRVYLCHVFMLVRRQETFPKRLILDGERHDDAMHAVRRWNFKMVLNNNDICLHGI